MFFPDSPRREFYKKSLRHGRFSPVAGDFGGLNFENSL
jgi:hypothetical protein